MKRDQIRFETANIGSSKDDIFREFRLPTIVRVANERLLVSDSLIKVWREFEMSGAQKPIGHQIVDVSKIVAPNGNGYYCPKHVATQILSGAQRIVEKILYSGELCSLQ